MSYLTSYIFPTGAHDISTNLVLGVSLGGHAAWQCLIHDPRITIGIVVIGCPDYIELMTQRASKSKLDSWTSSEPHGARFMGSEGFPQGLIDVVRAQDPAEMLRSRLGDASSSMSSLDDTSKHQLRAFLRDHIRGKRILNLSGRQDKLVPYECGEAFVKCVGQAISPDGWCSDLGIVLENVIFEGVGHEMTDAMAKKAVEFLSDALADTTVASSASASKM